jgi:hypothetical protein
VFIIVTALMALNLLYGWMNHTSLLRVERPGVTLARFRQDEGIRESLAGVRACRAFPFGKRKGGPCYGCLLASPLGGLLACCTG